MNKLITLVSALLFAFSFSYGQSDTLLFNFYHLKNGEVLIGNTSGANDTSITVLDQNLGEIQVRTKSVEKVEPVIKGRLVKIYLADNSVYRGRLLEVSDHEFIMELELAGMIRFKRSEIQELELLFEEKLDAPNPNGTRYFFGPSAIPLGKGNGYYQNVYLLMNSVNYGVNNNVSIGGGVVIPLLFFITPKVSFEVRRNFYLGAGFIAGTTIIPGAIMTGGIPYGIATVGNSENNLTLGVGYGMVWADGDYMDTDYPIFTLSGMKRLNNRFQLVSESWVVPYERRIEHYDPITYNYISTTTKTDAFVAASLGLRMIVGRRASLDFAPIYLYTNQGLVVPYLDFVYQF